MSVSRVKETGRGELEFRASIEGLDTEFVSHIEMQRTIADGRVRVTGLERDGISIEEKIDLLKAKSQQRGMTLTIVDVGERAGLALARMPALTTFLIADVTVAGTQIEVGSSDGISDGDVVHIGTEAMLVDTVVDTNKIDVVRAHWGTVAQAHYTSGGTIARAGYVRVTDRPLTLEGRLVRLYWYGEGDDPQGDGTLFWLGIVSQNATTAGDGASYQLRVDPITRLLKQQIGRDLEEPVKPRGIYYPWNAPLVVQVQRHTGASSATAPSGDPVIVRLAGFWETQESFCAELTTALQAATSTWDETLAAASEGSSGWRLTVRTDAATARWVTAQIISYIDDSPFILGDFTLWRREGGTQALSFGTDASYYVGVVGPVPRGVYGRDRGREALHPEWSAPDQASASPETRIYVGGDVVISTRVTAVQIEWPGDLTLEHDVTAIDAGDRWIEVRQVRDFSGGFEFLAYRSPDLPSMQLGRRYGTGNVGTLLQSIVDDAAEFATLGISPWLTATHIAISSIVARANVIAARRPIAGSRSYRAFAPKPLEEILAAECLLLGVIPVLDSTGKLTIRELTPPSATSPAAATIDASTNLDDRGFPPWEREVYGLVNTVTLLTGYDAIEDKHKGRVFHVVDGSSFEAMKVPREIVIAPVSVYSGGEAFIRPEEVVAIAEPLFAMFAGSYAVLTVEVPLSRFDVLVGDTVAVTIESAPNEQTGGRGITSRAALVLARKWDLAEGSGRLTLYLSLENFAGYTPSLLHHDALGRTDLGGNLWRIQFVGTNPAGGAAYNAAGLAFSTMFPVGAKVRIWKWDAAAPGTVTGTVTVVNDGTSEITIQFDGAFAPGTDDWILSYAIGTTAGLLAAQRAYAFTAGADFVIDFTPTKAGARVFAG